MTNTFKTVIVSLLSILLLSSFSFQEAHGLLEESFHTQLAEDNATANLLASSDSIYNTEFYSSDEAGIFVDQIKPAIKYHSYVFLIHQFVFIKYDLPFCL